MSQSYCSPAFQKELFGRLLRIANVLYRVAEILKEQILLSFTRSMYIANVPSPTVLHTYHSLICLHIFLNSKNFRRLFLSFMLEFFAAIIPYLLINIHIEHT